MAIGRFSMKVGKAGKASPHAAYIAREGRYAGRLERGEKLEATEAGNLPGWAQENPLLFWQAADAFERANGTTYREMELALPRELSPPQRLELVRDFVRQEIGERHAYQWAIHNPIAADGGEQPHAHLMFSERQCDGIARDPEQYFRRYNGKAPERGGARKGYGPRAGQPLSLVERIDELKALKHRWQDMVNLHLERAGQSVRIDLRSHAERGTGEVPEAKQLPSQWRGDGRVKVIAFRQARAELQEATLAVEQAVPDVRAEIVRLDDERTRRKQVQREAEETRKAREAEKQAAALTEAWALSREVIAQMSAPQLWEQIERIRPPSMSALIERDPAVVDSLLQVHALEDQLNQANARGGEARRETLGWREAHPLRAKVHDLGLVQAAYLLEREEILHDVQRQREALAPRKVEAEQRLEALREQITPRIVAEQAPLRTRLAELEAIAQQKTTQEAARKELEREFRGMAASRAMKAYGYGDNGKAWQATPKLLREVIDEYNRRPKALQEGSLAGWLDDPEKFKSIATMIELQRWCRREIDRGMSR